MESELSDSDRSVLGSARVGCLSTVDESGVPHLVPFCFALEKGAIYSSVDEKSQQTSTREMGRVRNIRATGWAAMVVHHYEEDWDNLGWIQIRGTARILAPGDPGHTSAVKVLREKYPQYTDQDLPGRPVIELTPRRVIRWGEPDKISD